MATLVYGTLKRRATGLGLTAGLAALLLWPVHVLWAGGARWPFVVALALACAAGLVLLAIGVSDLFRFSRGARVWPARMFDLALGLALAGPTGLALASVL